MSYVVAYEHFYFTGWKPAYGTRVPGFNVDPDRAYHWLERQPADRELEILSARNPRLDLRVEQHPALAKAAV